MTNDSGHEQRRAISDAAEKCSDTVNRAMLVLLATSFFCLVTAIGASDRSLLAPEASIKIPFAETNISFISFLAVAPLLIVVLTIYLHIFYGRWRGLDAERQAHGLFESSPALFSINRWAPRLLTAFTFYWLAPVVLAIITWKASARLEWSLPIALMTGLVIAGLILSRIFPLASSKWQRMRAISLGLIGVLAVALPITVGILAFLDEEKHDSWERGLYLFRTDLKDVWLKKARLHSADLSFAVLTGANLNYSKLKGARLTEANLTQAKLLSVDLRGAFSPSAILNDADLTWADLTRATLTGVNFIGANLTRATLVEATLYGADLTGANLTEANLTRARLRGANLTDAKLTGANLKWTDLRGVHGLKCDQLVSSIRDETTKLDEAILGRC